MKKKFVIILLLFITVLLVGGGIVIWKLSSNKEKVSSSSNQQKKNPSLNELSDQELEKCLLENFSRRLELEKYFVFNLQKEVKTEKGFFNNKPADNVRIVNNQLCQDLTKLTESLLKKRLIKKEIDLTNYAKVAKRAVTFCGKGTNQVPDEWTKDNLDEKITNGEEWYIIFDKSKEVEEQAYFTTIFEDGQDTGKLAWNGHVIVKVEGSGSHLAKSRFEALEFLKKNDPALSDESL